MYAAAIIWEIDCKFIWEILRYRNGACFVTYTAPTDQPTDKDALRDELLLLGVPGEIFQLSVSGLSCMHHHSLCGGWLAVFAESRFHRSEIERLSWFSIMGLYTLSALWEIRPIERVVRALHCTGCCWWSPHSHSGAVAAADWNGCGSRQRTSSITTMSVRLGGLQ